MPLRFLFRDSLLPFPNSGCEAIRDAPELFQFTVSFNGLRRQSSSLSVEFLTTLSLVKQYRFDF